MITKLTLDQAKKGKLFNWAHKLDYFSDNKVIEFKPGLNIIVGPNASGKSTLLNMLATYLAAKQGGVSTITQSWVSEVMDFSHGHYKNRLPFKVDHDGQPIVYVNPRDNIGLEGGSFDDDFLLNGVLNCRAKGSNGELNAKKMEESVAAILGIKPAHPEFMDWRIPVSKDNAGYRKKLLAMQDVLSPTIDVGQKTILMDEPDAGFSIVWQYGFWANVMSQVEQSGYQVIIASHSMFAMGMPNANYIELAHGICDKYKSALSYLQV